MATPSIRRATPADDGLIADNFYLMWQDYDLHHQLTATWKEETLRFITNARDTLEYAAFIAELNGEPSGSAACQVFAGLYPGIFKTEERKQGYIWGVYVTPEQRGKGTASALTRACNRHLEAIGCTRISLNASPLGRPVYEKLGFVNSNEMILELKHDKDA